MDYKSYYEEARKKLESQNSISEFRKYYENATKRINSSYDSSMDEISEKYRSDVNEAEAKSMIDKKNTAQFMASRGLSRSGEAEQEEINSNLSLNNTMSSLAKDKSHAEKELAKQKNELLSNAERDYLGHKADYDKRLDEEASKIAENMSEEDRRNADIARENQMLNQEREYEEQSKREQREYEKQKIQDDHDFKEKMTRLQAELYGNRSSGDTGYSPGQTPEQLAKNLVQLNTDTGKRINTPRDKVRLYYALNEISKDVTSQPYLNELNLILRTYGYKAPTGTELDAYRIVENTRSYYESQYAKYMKYYTDQGYMQYMSDNLARAKLDAEMIDYYFRVASNEALFDCCCYLAGFTDELINDFKNSDRYKKRLSDNKMVDLNE